MIDNKTNIKVSSLYVYPLKSGHESSLNESLVTETGLLNDRTLVVLNRQNHNFLSIRTHPKLYNIKTHYEIEESQYIDIFIPIENGEYIKFRVDLSFNLEELDKSKIFNIFIWQLPCDVYPVEIVNNELNILLSSYLEQDVILVKPITKREFKNYIPKEKFNGLEKESDSVFFADLAPILIVSEESFIFLKNQMINKGDDSLDIINFRPNIVLSGGGEHFWEGKINRIKIRNVIYRRIKPCTRCKITTFDTKLKKFRSNKEPLEILSDLRFDEKLEGVLFGENFSIDFENDDKIGIIKVGDEVFIID